MLSRQKLDCGVLVCAVALTRFLFRSQSLYDLDSVNFALALQRFDPSVHQPHPPGYFLYILLGRLVNAFFHDPNAALVTVSIAASCGAAVMLYVLAGEWFGTMAARFAGALFLVSPLAWFHGIVALTYIVEAFFSALIGYLCWRVYVGGTRYAAPSALVLGLAAGVRPSTLLFLGPLFLFSLWRVPRGKALAALGTLTATLLAWFVPMLYASGGPAAYFSALSFLWESSPGKQNVLSQLLLLSFARFCTVAGLYALCFGAATLLFARSLATKAPENLPRLEFVRQRTFTWVWTAPAVLFFTFVFFRFINSGYVLVVFPPLCAWVAGWAADWYRHGSFLRAAKLALIAIAAAVNIGIFLQAPFYCSYRAVRSFDAELDSVRRAVPQVAVPGRTLLIGFDSHFLGFRHAGYYFPGYMIAEYPEVRFPEGNRIFTMQDRDTRLISRLPTSRFTNFVLFPLPQDGPEYHQHFAEMRALLSQDATAVTVEGHEFLIGPIEDLPVLFPIATAPWVSTQRDSPSEPVYKR